jgi:hypothetical protein
MGSTEAKVKVLSYCDRHFLYFTEISHISKGGCSSLELSSSIYPDGTEKMEEKKIKRQKQKYLSRVRSLSSRILRRHLSSRKATYVLKQTNNKPHKQTALITMKKKHGNMHIMLFSGIIS